MQAMIVPEGGGFAAPSMLATGLPSLGEVTPLLLGEPVAEACRDGPLGLPPKDPMANGDVGAVKLVAEAGCMGDLHDDIKFAWCWQLSMVY